MSLIQKNYYEDKAKLISHHFPRNKVTRKKISQLILSSIHSGLSVPEYILDTGLINHSDLKNIQNIYTTYSKGNNIFPKYLPYYIYIKENIKGFDWEIIDDNVYLTLPSVDYGTPTILCMLKSIIDGVNIYQHPMRDVFDFPVFFTDYFLDDLRAVFIDNNIVKISQEDWKGFVDLIIKGLSGETINLVTVICPDYSYEQNMGKFTYTFESLGEGIGLVALRAIKLITSFSEFLNKHKIENKIIIFSGDFEALNYECTHSLGETTDSFINKVKKSSIKCANEISEETVCEFFIDSDEKSFNWQKMTENTIKQMEDLNFGKSNLNENKIKEIITKRKALYINWYGKQKEDFYQKKVLEQGAEYANMGKIINDKYNNTLILGADHEVMRDFYDFHSKTVVIYKKRWY